VTPGARIVDAPLQPTIAGAHTLDAPRRGGQPR
jgi:hypothetical protein